MTEPEPFEIAVSQDALDDRPNDLLIWEGMELACALGCRQLDLGPSDDDQHERKPPMQKAPLSLRPLSIRPWSLAVALGATLAEVRDMVAVLRPP